MVESQKKKLNFRSFEIEFTGKSAQPQIFSKKEMNHDCSI